MADDTAPQRRSAEQSRISGDQKRAAEEADEQGRTDEDRDNASTVEVKTFQPGNAPQEDLPTGEKSVGVSPEWQRTTTDPE